MQTIEAPAVQAQEPEAPCHTPLIAEVAAIKELIRHAKDSAVSRANALDQLVAAVDEALAAEPNSTIANILHGALEAAREESKRVLILSLEDAQSRIAAIQRDLVHSNLPVFELHIGSERFITLADECHLRVAWGRYMSRASTIGMPEHSRMFTWTPVRYISYRDILARIHAIEPAPKRRRLDVVA